MSQNVFKHTDTSNTKLLISKTRYQSILSSLTLELLKNVTSFKERFANHIRDFKHPKYRNSTGQLKYTYRNSKMLIYHQLLNGVLLQKCYQKHI